MKMLLILLLWTHSAWALGVDSPLPSAQDETRARALFVQIRCMVCTGESIADSPANVAADLRRSVREQITQGKTDADILGFLHEHYGDEILMRPPVRPSTWLLWFGPLLILLAGGRFVTRFLAGDA